MVHKSEAGSQVTDVWETLLSSVPKGTQSEGCVACPQLGLRGGRANWSDRCCESETIDSSNDLEQGGASFL